MVIECNIKNKSKMMKKTAYLAPAVEIEMIQTETLLNTVSRVGGNTGIVIAKDDEDVPGTAQSRYLNVWGDDEDEIY